MRDMVMTDYILGVIVGAVIALTVAALKMRNERRGYWIEWAEFFGRGTGQKNLGVFCSRCRKHADNKFSYCPNCGAKMGGGTDDGKMDSI